MSLFTTLLLSWQIGVGQCLTVDAEWVTARDVSERIPSYAEIDSDLRLVRAPFPGARRVISSTSLPPREGGFSQAISAFCVERRLRRLSIEMFDQALRRSLDHKGGTDIAFEVVDYDRSMLPSGKLEFATQSLPPPIPGRLDDTVLWRGKLFYAEGQSVPVWVRLRLWIEDDVCIVGREVPRGEDVRIEDCKIGKKRYAPFIPPPLREPTALEGTTAARKMKIDEPIFQAMLARKPEVKAGQPVELKITNGGTQLRLQARAVSSGRRGDSVVVTNPSNGKRLEGHVVAEGLVEVRLK